MRVVVAHSPTVVTQPTGCAKIPRMSTRRPIRPLPEQLINQIAAGEVIERPASVVKELLENSIDAGADRVEIEIAAGGRDLIRITDNGSGIPPAELPLALARHASSKLGSLAELERIASLGFRGEALASIAAVSRLSLISRTREEDSAWRLDLEGGAGAERPVPAAHPVGTTVEVRDLFFNTPVRRRFLRSEHTELHHLVEAVRRVALGRDGLRVRLYQGGRRLLEITAGSQQERLFRVFGARFREGAIRVEAATAGMRLSGWLGHPELSRSQSDRQYLLLNGRWIRDQGLFHAVRQAYGDALPEGRHPLWFLQLEIDPLRVDVNVHPAKSEVRFREPRQVHDFVLGALLRALGGVSASIAVPVAGAARPRPVLPPAGTREAPPPGYRSSPSPGEGVPAATPVRALARVGGCLLARHGDELWLIDVARTEREVLKRRLRERLERGALRSQPLLLPVRKAIGDGELPADYLSALRGLGLEMRQEGKQVLLTHVPALLAGADPQRLLDALVPARLEEELVAALADAARGTRALSTDEHLLAALEELDEKVRNLCLAVLGEAELLTLLRCKGGDG